MKAPKYITERYQKYLDAQEHVKRLEIALQEVKKEVLATEDEEEKEYLLEVLKVTAREYRITRSSYDILYFAYEYFSADRNPNNDDNLIPSGVSIEDAPDFHHTLTDELTKQAYEDITRKICWSVPRGHAKSMFMSNIYPIHSVVFGLRKYILIISETESMAQNFVKYVSDQLKFNDKLREDFGSLLEVAKMANTMDNLEGFITSSNIKVQAGSIGKQIRGARHGAVRPDLVILDDLESSSNTNTRELREKNLHWYNSVVEPVGTPENTAFVYMGTLVHGQGLLPDVMQRPEYHDYIYSAIVSEPDNHELWDEYEKILRDIDNDNRLEDSEQFYQKNKKKMDKGVKTLWDRFTYQNLIKKKVELGSRAFASEYLNRASDKESSTFDSDLFVFYTDNDLYDKVGNLIPLELFGFWDMALGKNKRSDYNAIVTLGRDRRTGVIYVLDAWAKKVPLHKASDQAFKMIKETGHRFFGVESVQAQYESYRQLQERLYKEKVYATRVKPIMPRGNKEQRIELLEPLIEAGMIRFRKDQRLLLEMLEQFPNHDHDDLPDALASCVNMMGGTRTTRTYQVKPQGL